MGPSFIAQLRDESESNDVQRMIEVLEDEMLLRSDVERELVFPMHPYRSKLLAEIIAPMLYQSEEELALNAAKCARRDESVAIQTFSRACIVGDSVLKLCQHPQSATWRLSNTPPPGAAR